MSAILQHQYDTDCITLSTGHASVDIFACGASVHNYAVSQAGGSIFKPFAEAPWLDQYRDSQETKAPRHLQLLGGEFPCVPFGTTMLDTAHHGYCVDHDWRVTEQSDNAATFEIDYPESHIVRSLKRSVKLDPQSGALNFTLDINARKSGTLSVGIHPIFKIADDMQISLPDFDRGASAPWTIDENDRRQLAAGASIGQSSLFWKNIGTAHSELLQIWHVKGGVSVHYPSEHSSVSLNWNQNHLPHCLFWLANPGLRTQGLGNGFTGLGVEPTHSFFDKNDRANDHFPLHQNAPNHFGIHLNAGQVWTTSYQISCRMSGRSET